MDKKRRISKEQLEAFLDSSKIYEGYTTPLSHDLARDLKKAREEIKRLKEEEERTLTAAGEAIAGLFEQSAGGKIQGRSRKEISKLIKEVAEGGA